VGRIDLVASGTGRLTASEALNPAQPHAISQLRIIGLIASRPFAGRVKNSEPVFCPPFDAFAFSSAAQNTRDVLTNPAFARRRLKKPAAYAA
jgi:hypothetical protein